jgi:hypothetical protein
MCSIVEAPTRSAGSRLAALVGHMGELGAEVAALLADPETAAEIAALPGDALAGFVTSLASMVDAGTAALTVVTGHVDAGGGRGSGCLIAGRYASTSRFLQVETGMSKQTASATIARARDLRGDYSVLAEPWLSGRVSSDAVREMTVGVRDALKATTLPATERDVARASILASVLPVAEVGTVADVKHVIGRLRLLTDEDGANQAALDAHAEQSLTCEQVGSMSRITAWVTHEVAAAAMTVLERRVATMQAEGDLAPEEQLPPGADPGTWDGRRRANLLHGHLLALALGDTFTDSLDDNRVGSHHGIAPHVTVTVDVARFEAGMGADLTMPGSDDPVPLANDTVRRILCDADLTTVITRALTTPDAAADTGSDAAGAGADGERCTQPLADLLLEASREVLYVGRTERVVPPRLRRALDARDRHCQFPGCRAHVRRCHAHHVREWEHGGRTDLDNTLLLCVRHHHAVHEGGWRITRTPGIPPGGTGCWRFTPPARRTRP